jgi:hypothetical protein
VVFKYGDFMKKLILLATLFLLTSCDTLTGAKPKPSTTPTPLANESSDPNAPIASGALGTPGAETPGPTSSGSPVPSQMPTNPTAAGNPATPPVPPTTIVAGNAPLSNGGNPPPAPGVATSNTGAETKQPVKVIGSKSANASPDQNSLVFNGDPGGVKENSKDPKVKMGKGGKVADESLDPSASYNNPTASNPQKSVSPQIITDGGIGAAKVGMTLAELKKTLKNSARFETQTDFTPGYNALAIRQKGKVQFYIPYPKKKKVNDNDKINILVTDNPIYKTAEGISPGMSIKKATEVYGDARLGYNPKTSLEEIVMFTRQPGELLFFSGGTERNGRAGIYPSKQQSNEQGFVTNKYGNNGRIKRITVVCPDSICAPSQP